MKKVLKTKTAGAGSQQSVDGSAEGIRPMNEGPVVFNGEPEATPPDIIVEN